MNISALMNSLPFLATFLLITLIGVIAAQSGFWIGRKRNQRENRDEKKDDNDSLGTVVGALLGFLAFMLAVTFSYTESRFSNRKAIVIQQANALNTLYLRSGVIPDKQKVEVRKLLREYLDILVNIRSSTEMENNITKLEQIHTLIWNQAASLANENMDSELRSLFVGGVNQMIEVFSERKTIVLVYHIPNIIWICLLLLYIVGAYILGTEFSTHKKKRLFDTILITGAFALIVALIADMDSNSPVGHLQVSQQ